VTDSSPEETTMEVEIERPVSGRPHEGNVLVAIQPHADDIPLFCAGTVAKLIDEGYTAYLINTTNDEKCGPTDSIGETILQNEREVDELARCLGFRKVFNLGYRNHRMDEASPTELRARLIFLFRYLKVDTVFTCNPWGGGEENPDHTVTGRAVEAACWMAGIEKDYPEQIAAGFAAREVTDKYYWVIRPGQPWNRVVDISPYTEQKIAAMSVNKAQGPAGSNGRRLKARLAEEGRRLPALDGDDEAADRAYIRLFCLQEYADIGERHGLELAERFFYVPKGGTFNEYVTDADIAAYTSEHAVPIGRGERTI
jgi:LmbE family N-acetylglucosaminyl deacetylase